MTTTAKIIADSVSAEGHRLTTLELRYPRFIHAELLTHRVFSRNASSSRAVPVVRLVTDVMMDPAIPSHWGKNRPGMQAREEQDALVSVPTETGGCEDLTREKAWLYARDRAVDMARCFHEAGYHKQIVNRLLEPFAHINVVLSGTDWDNFFALRIHADAQPEMRELAEAISLAVRNSEAELVLEDCWHLPYVSLEERALYPVQTLCRISAARCARVSYKTHEGAEPVVAKDVDLAERLIADGHMSPFEHQARPALTRTRNFTGWQQFRHRLEGAR